MHSLMEKPLKDRDRVLNRASREAANNNQIDVIEYLIANGVDSEKVPFIGLLGAAIGEHPQLMKFFLDQGASQSDIEKVLRHPEVSESVVSVRYLLEQLPVMRQRSSVNALLAREAGLNPELVTYLKELRDELNRQ